MPLHQLAVEPSDVSGQKLGLALNAPAPPPLATCLLHHPDDGALRLGVLGASHVVTVEHAAGRFSEEVSCTARGVGVDLPEHTAAPGYSLQTRTESYDEAAFRRMARDLRDLCAREKGWLGGTFPGDDAALTALAAEPDGAGWHWQTWHLYPRSPFGCGGDVVHTVSRWHP
ncbi:DUF2617 family protein [Mycobacterium sp. E2733]|uniref:DUF2617 family protein n=1 Tax=Mycobacterium sp. E2733 TaxID=1834138 RepID=UPI00080044E8|nr:DUF2617 family protein [Mycobacterium sp. E2733]OBH98413.1 hypothetical protein A5678_01945 [Mycobacterium sp. E2733]